jgi:hypothetical protein
MNERLRKWYRFRLQATLLIRTLLVGLVVFATLKYVVDFSARQSAVLAAIGALVFYLLLTLQKPPFVPYHVFVQPKIRSILKDFELLKDTEEEWAALWSKVEKLPQAPWNIWTSGFSVSFLSPDLIYKNGWNNFANKLDMNASLEPVGGIFNPDWSVLAEQALLVGSLEKTEQEGWEREGGECPPLLPLSVGLRFKRGWWSLVRGYELIIELPSEHWAKVRRNDALKGIRDDDVRVDHRCGRVEVQLALIPDDEFAVHQTRSESEYEDAIRDRAGMRPALGWKGIAQGADSYSLETPADRSNEIEHRYFRVSHSTL